MAGAEKGEGGRERDRWKGDGGGGGGGGAGGAMAQWSLLTLLFFLYSRALRRFHHLK